MSAGVFIPITALALLLSFLFSGMEAGVSALSRLRIRQLMRRGHVNAKVLHGFLENPENFLWTILVGNTLANLVAVALLVMKLHEIVAAHPLRFVAGLLVLAFLLYTLCELLPKLLFRQFPNRLCLLLARPFRLIHIVLAPLVALVAHFSKWLLRWTGGKAFTGHLFGNREEFRVVMQESAQNLTSEERAMINRVLDLQNVTVRQVTIPLEKTVTVTTATPLDEVKILCREKHFARLPVWDDTGNRKRIVGLITLDSVLFRPDGDNATTAGELVKPALFLEEDMRLEVALQRMRRAGQRLALVLGPSRREVGIVSIQDIFKIIFGEVSL